MDEVIRMSNTQYKSACALIRGICCNYDRPTGWCWELDTECPQMITQSLICKYFRDVLLEDRDGKALKAEIMGEDYRKTCEVCGQQFRALSNRAKYCAKCAGRMRLKRQREYMRSRKG